MLVFATSDKGGTGRSVTSSNMLYRRALQGSNVAYLDFDFGSPTAGAIFNIEDSMRGTRKGGLHRYLRSEIALPTKLDVWRESARGSLRGKPDGAGKLTLFPGDEGGGEFIKWHKDIVGRCVELFSRLEEEFAISLVDLSAGRSFATDLVLEATSPKNLPNITSRWLVFHRWTRQHVYAANGLVYGDRGIIDSGAKRGHDREQLRRNIRFVRTAVVDPRAQTQGLQPPQIAWLTDVNEDLRELAGQLRIGRMNMLGSVPLDPVLQWREQLISDTDTITRQIANPATVDAFVTLAKNLTEKWTEL
ncbi:SCO2523 family variant P-loop protein [Phytomonospora sp. NPDC050363]|uniref:SCO2523 family variant P-loop protein n=1 Tax=Phytomonospora sp. NPDC050363 TaxID=3155642 RepID=UPI0033CC26EF